MQTKAKEEQMTVEQALWDEAAITLHEIAGGRVIVPDEHCSCLGCEVARLHLLPFLPVTWH